MWARSSASCCELEPLLVVAPGSMVREVDPGRGQQVEIHRPVDLVADPGLAGPRHA